MLEIAFFFVFLSLILPKEAGFMVENPAVFSVLRDIFLEFMKPPSKVAPSRKHWF